MSNWSLSFTKESEKELVNLDSSVRQRVVEKLQWLEENAGLVFHKELSRDLKGSYKLRVGDWRVVYLLNEKNFGIIVIKIDHRSKVYKKK